MNSHIICALDTSSLDDALATVSKLKYSVGAFKIGHALTLNYGVSVVGRLRDQGAERVFVDLKFHDIPNSVALAVREVAKSGAWMMTVHTSGGAAMMRAAAEAVAEYPVETRPLIVGVSVLTSLSAEELSRDLSIGRTVEQQMLYLSALALDCGLAGAVCSPHEIKALRECLPASAKIVVPGIRLAGGATHDQARVADPSTALRDGADYLVMGRALTEADDPLAVLAQCGRS